MNPDTSRLMTEDFLIPVLAIGCGTVIAVVAIIFTTVKAMVVSRNREQTKRELAAYVAEGSLDPEKAIAMINAGRPQWEVGKSNGGGKSCCG